MLNAAWCMVHAAYWRMLHTMVLAHVLTVFIPVVLYSTSVPCMNFCSAGMRAARIEKVRQLLQAVEKSTDSTSPWFCLMMGVAHFALYKTV